VRNRTSSEDNFKLLQISSAMYQGTTLVGPQNAWKFWALPPPPPRSRIFPQPVWHRWLLFELKQALEHSLC
jgi:hypothetical protein